MSHSVVQVLLMILWAQLSIIPGVSVLKSPFVLMRYFLVGIVALSQKKSYDDVFVGSIYLEVRKKQATKSVVGFW